jgi:hypothetical protein
MSTDKERYSRLENEDLDEETGYKGALKPPRFSLFRILSYGGVVILFILLGTSALTLLPKKRAMRNGRWDPQTMLPASKFPTFRYLELIH